MADAAVAIAERGEEELDDIQSVPTADVASALGKKPQSLSPARDALLKKGLIYSGERGRIAFTVPALRAVPARARLTRARPRACTELRRGSLTAHA